MKGTILTAPAKYLPGIVARTEWQQAECDLIDVLIYDGSLPELPYRLPERPISAHYHHHQLVLLSY
jgi:hypothetical protein